MTIAEPPTESTETPPQEPRVILEIQTPQPMKPDISVITSMAALFQRWAEKCEQASKDELTPELSWFLKGAAFAFGLDAQRARSLADPSKAKKPPVGDLGLGQAFEIMIGMLRSMSMAGDQATTLTVTDDDDSDTIN